VSLDEYLTKQELSKLLKVHETTIDRWRKEGMPFKKVSRKVLFVESEVKDWINQKSK
jgi:excisionase family DNA binding protein